MSSDSARAAVAIAIEGLRKVYRVRRGDDVVAVDGFDLRVERGEVRGLLGPNGAGKTTTVEICEGLLEPTDGSVRILGRHWSEDAFGIRERIGVTLQETQLFERQTVGELIRLFCAFYRDSISVEEALAATALEDLHDRRFGKLSGGQKQRLAVAIALVGRPELLFLDEPTTGLDPQSRRSLWEVVRRFRDDGGTVLLTTHYMEEAETLCDRITIIDHGKSIAEGSPEELVHDLGAAHIVEVEAEDLRDRVDSDSVLRLPSVAELEWDRDRMTVAVASLHDSVPALLRHFDGIGVQPSALSTRRRSLEDVFVHLTGRHLRDGEGES
ncbi:MAG: ABC transporter ATP-binding protein [Planctomycetota bacterium]